MQPNYIKREDVIYLLNTIVVHYGNETNRDVEYGIKKAIDTIKNDLSTLKTYRCYDGPVEYWEVSPKDSSLKALCEMAEKYNIEITIDGSLGR